MTPRTRRVWMPYLDHPGGWWQDVPVPPVRWGRVWLLGLLLLGLGLAWLITARPF